MVGRRPFEAPVCRLGALRGAAGEGQVPAELLQLLLESAKLLGLTVVLAVFGIEPVELTLDAFLEIARRGLDT
eukprot:1449803-Pyramimonas_sp.AAC.1